MHVVGPRTGQARPLGISNSDAAICTVLCVRSSPRDDVCHYARPTPARGVGQAATLVVSGDNVTVPVLWSTRPAEVVAMLSTNDGNWKITGPEGG